MNKAATNDNLVKRLSCRIIFIFNIKLYIAVIYICRAVIHYNCSPSSSGDVVHVFMSSFSETADAENTASSTRFSMYVCSK